MYKFKISIVDENVSTDVLTLSLKVRRDNKYLETILYYPSEILDLITELETRDQGYYDHS